jgi:DNA repair protein RecN (Recombination protein N)
MRVLETLELSNFAIVDKLNITLSPGLNVLTGETGAGKSILIDALALLIGARADSSWIRSGEDTALIQGQFTGDLVASRRLNQQGRSTARLNGEMVTAGELQERLGSLVTIHGQHASQVLSNVGEQRKLLDRLLPETAKQALISFQETYTRYQKLGQTLSDLKTAMRERARRIDVLSFQVDEINAANLNKNELSTLKEELESQRFAERIVKHAHKSLVTLSEADINALELLADAHRELEIAGRYNKALLALERELKDAMTSVEAISQELSSFLNDFEMEAGYLESLENRLALIENLQRKYGDSIEAVLTFRDESANELANLLNAEEAIGHLEVEQKALLTELETTAKTLSKARKKLAKELSEKVSQEIRPLGMENAVFQIDIQEAASLSPFGKDTVQFNFSANLGEEPSALASIASGGELSRVMLALNVVTGSDVPILAFDEVDAGIGGKTARSVGSLLKQLAKDHQILVVTHLPQVAAFADAQFYVEKQELAGRTVTKVNRLEPHERELELARMLSGSLSDAALANARELLREASF